MIPRHTGRSPLVNKNMEHIFGAKNLPSDDVNQVVSNKFMKDAYALDKLKKEKYMLQKKASGPRGVKERQTLTSLMRVEEGKRIRD